MFRFLRNLDTLSFWLGFLAATVFWGLINLLKPYIERFLASLRDQSQVSRLGAAELVDIRIRNDVTRYAQRMHLAAPLFALDEIAITPRLLIPPALVEPGVPPPFPDITEQVIPYQPDTPELASFYGAPTFTLPEVLKGNANVAILGHPGSGKSVALAYLATLFARRDKLSTDHKNLLPLLVNAGDVQPQVDTPSEEILAPLLVAIARVCPSVQAGRLESYLSDLFSKGNILLLYDGLDEFPPDEFNQQVAYLSRLLQKYPQIRIVTAVTPIYYGDLTRLNFVPLAIANWDDSQRREFINRWSEVWISQIGPLSKESEAIDPILLNAWLTNDNTILSPLELTCKVWGVYAGDLRGPKILDWIEAYVQRMSAGINKGRAALELLAGQSLLALKPNFHQKDAPAWLREIEPLPAGESATETSAPEEEKESPPPLKSDRPTQPTVKPIRDSRVVPALEECGLLIARTGDRLAFIHPLIHSYLAAFDLAAKGWYGGAFTFDPWSTAWYALGFLAARRDIAAPVLKPFIEHISEPLCREQVIAARWLRYAPDNAHWRGDLMRQLVKIFQNEAYSLGLRARALTVIALSGSAGLDTLLRQYLVSPDSMCRQLAALACGMLRDAKAINDLTTLLKDPNLNVRRAASLGMVAIGHQSALEAVAEMLLQGDEDQRRAAAEALANDVEEGHPTLKEGSTLDDVRVRRAVVHGLRRIRHPWAVEKLQQMQVSDSQWVVKDAATQVLEEKAQADPRLPKLMPEITETPWLIGFAGERGVGVSPGKPALDLVLLALNEGKEEQRLAALDYLTRFPEANAISTILEVYSKQHGETREAAFSTLWHYAAAGVYQTNVETHLGKVG